MTHSTITPEQENIVQAQDAVQEQEDMVQVEDTVMEVPIYPEFETDTAIQKPQKRIFWKVLTTCFALFLVLITTALWFFYNYLKKYEASTPTGALNNYIQWIRDKDYDAIYAVSDFEETILNTKEEFIKYLERTYAGDVSTLTVREKTLSAESDERKKEYSVYIDEKRVCGLTLLKNPEWGETAWSYVTEIQYQPTTTIYAADDVRITINGVDLSLLNLPSSPAQTALLGGVKDEQMLPTVSCYTLEGLLNPPTIEALTLNGDTCNIVQTEKAAYHIYQPVADALRTEREQLAQKTAFKYAEFVARDATRADVLKLVYKDSDLYGTIRNFSNHWFTGHDTYKFTDVVISAYTQYTRSDFSCNVSFQPIYTRKKQTIKGTPFNCRLSFVLIDDEWKLLSLTQFAAQTEETDSTTTTTSTTGTTVPQ